MTSNGWKLPMLYLPRLRSWVQIPSPAPIFSFKQACGAVRDLPPLPCGVGPIPPSLADVERVSVLQVKMQMGAVNVVGFRSKHCGEHLAGALMHAPEELGLRK